MAVLGKEANVTGDDGADRVGRPEVPLDPAGGPVVAFADALRALRRAAGGPTYASLAQRSGVSSSSLSEAARGRRLPTWTTVEAFVEACGGDPREWRERWEAAGGDVGLRPPIAGQQLPTVGKSVVSQPRAWRIPLTATVIVVLLAFAVAGVLVLRPTDATSPRPAHVDAGPQTTSSSPPGTWIRVMGPGCGPNRTGAQIDIDKGWTPSGGGWTGDGCAGNTVTTPLFDSPTDWNRTVGWAFEPNFPATCLLEVYVPDSPDAAGSAIYRIFGKDATSDAKLIAKSPPIPQQDYHGQWVAIGTYRFPDGIITVELGNLGVGTQQIAADAMRVTCH
jgi:hypothetical protein